MKKLIIKQDEEESKQDDQYGGEDYDPNDYGEYGEEEVYEGEYVGEDEAYDDQVD